MLLFVIPRKRFGGEDSSGLLGCFNWVADNESCNTWNRTHAHDVCMVLPQSWCRHRFPTWLHDRIMQGVSIPKQVETKSRINGDHCIIFVYRDESRSKTQKIYIGKFVWLVSMVLYSGRLICMANVDEYIIHIILFGFSHFPPWGYKGFLTHWPCPNLYRPSTRALFPGSWWPWGTFKNPMNQRQR